MPFPFEFDFRKPDYTAVFVHRAERLKRIRAKPELIPALKAYYRDNPSQFIIDWGCTFDPRNVERGLPAVIPFLLFEKQQEWCDWLVRKWKNQEYAPVVKSRDMGLSWLTVAMGVTMSLFNNDMVIGYGSRKEEYVDKIGDPKSLFWKAREFTMLLPPEFRGGFVRGKTDPHMRLIYPETGSALIGEAGDSIGRGNRASIYFVDEAAFLERPKLVDASLSQTTNCRIDVSTPNGMANPFAVKVKSGKFDNFIFHWRDDPRKDDQWYEAQKGKLDAVTVAQEIDIDFAASVEGVLIPSAWVQSAINAHEKLGFNPRGERTAALDVADRGIDKNALAFKDGVLVESVHSWHGSTVEDIFGTTERAFNLCNDKRAFKVTYDSDGLGAGCRGDGRIVNDMRKENKLRQIKMSAFHGSGEIHDKKGKIADGRTNESFFDNYKAQCWWGLRSRFKKTHEAIEKGVVYPFDELISLSSDCSATLVTELSQPTYKKNGAGKILIDKAPNGSPSPNEADSVMMLFDLKASVDYGSLL